MLNYYTKYKNEYAELAAVEQAFKSGLRNWQ